MRFDHLSRKSSFDDVYSKEYINSLEFLSFFFEFHFSCFTYSFVGAIDGNVAVVYIVVVTLVVFKLIIIVWLNEKYGRAS